MKARFGLFVGYLQDDSDKLREVIDEALSLGDAELIDEFVESDFKKFPALENACAVAKENKAVVITPTFKRIGSSLAALNILVKNKVKIVVVDEPFIEESRSVKDLIILMRDQAEYQLETHSKKVRQGLNKARAKGKKFGAPLGSKNLKLARKANMHKAEEFTNRIYPIILDLKSKGARTNKEIARGLEARGILTSSGKSKWYESSIRMVIKKGEKND